MFEPTSIGTLAKPWRLRLVDRILGQIEGGEVDTDTALQMIDQAGMTGDREALSVALAARALLLYGEHPGWLAAYERERDAALARLATPRVRLAVWA